MSRVVRILEPSPARLAAGIGHTVLHSPHKGVRGTYQRGQLEFRREPDFDSLAAGRRTTRARLEGPATARAGAIMIGGRTCPVHSPMRCPSTLVAGSVSIPSPLRGRPHDAEGPWPDDDDEIDCEYPSDRGAP